MDINCAQYLERVERALYRATKREKKEIRAELQGHLEDHREVFLSLGCTPTEADHRAAEAMGDPGETGRALNDQLSTFWLVMEYLGRVLAVTSAAILLALLFGRSGVLSRDWLAARFGHPAITETGPVEPYVAGRLNIKVDNGVDTLRIYEVRVTPETGTARILCSIYDPDPLGEVTIGMYEDRFQYLCPDGSWAEMGHRYFWDHYGKSILKSLGDIPLSPGQEVIALRYHYKNAVFDLSIPLKGVWE